MHCPTHLQAEGGISSPLFLLTRTANVTTATALVSAQPILLLKDPEGGLLFLAYTPRPPSIATEIMLRCAYRVGLTGKILDGAWNIYNSSSSSDNDKCRTSSTAFADSPCRDCSGNTRGAQRGSGWERSRGGSEQSVSDVIADACNNKLEERRAEDEQHGRGNSIEPNRQSNRPKSNITAGDNRCSNGTTTQNGSPFVVASDVNTQRTAGPAPGYCRRSVLLAFQPSSKPPVQNRPPITEDRNNSCVSEAEWLSEWREMFPCIVFKATVAADPVARIAEGGRGQGSLLRKGGSGGKLDDEITVEYLWGGSLGP